MKKTYLSITVLLGLLLVVSLSAVTRISYTHPGQMIKIPTTSTDRSPYLFSAGFGTEIHSFSPFNTARGVYFYMDLSKNFTLGFSSGQGADTTALLAESQYVPPVEFGFHVQQRLYTRGDISFSIGIHDIVFENADTGVSLDPKQLSFFGVLGSQKPLGDYSLRTYMGFGTGGFAQQTATLDTTTTTDTTGTEAGTNAGVFAGFILNTPFMPKWGGLDFVGEFDGTGINVGLRIPLTSDYRLSLGFTHIQNLPNWTEPYDVTHPGFTMGLDMSVPRGVGKEVPSLPSGEAGPYPVPEEGMYDSVMVAADAAVSNLRDSLRVSEHELRNLATQIAQLKQKNIALEDSVKTMMLVRNKSQKNINRAMRHLSRSLRYFYSGDYREALQEVETALELNPNLALAYARRGSIYYKLGDTQRATINWNLALQMDPEYDDVRNILKALHENRLKTTSFSRE
ncbi:MAG: tetratricopeptide repeat protein [Fidelibacterota bacterium]